MNSEDSFNPQEGLQNQAGNELFERSENDSLPAGPPLEPPAAEHLPEAFSPSRLDRPALIAVTKRHGYQPRAPTDS
ncbi:hypothetical protein ACYFX5_00345 [Bremerella sp. T1]|uniref:hypothetical protein n=1 Tax=Bremerella sp. TYQ1 TaxID=3119568 RepID=UPI001CCE936C|nr:hypothetical protein [Bremerella volcania]UBM36740.1 hypothetical protein LA756_02305 [Bremerella volcania]